MFIENFLFVGLILTSVVRLLLNYSLMSSLYPEVRRVRAC